MFCTRVNLSLETLHPDKGTTAARITPVWLLVHCARVGLIIIAEGNNKTRLHLISDGELIVALAVRSLLLSLSISDKRE